MQKKNSFFLALPSERTLGRQVKGTIKRAEYKKKHHNFMRKEAPRGIAEGDPRLEWVTLVKTLVAQLGIFVARDEDGKEYLPHVECYVDDFRETDHEELLNINVHNIKSIEYSKLQNPVKNHHFWAILFMKSSEIELDSLVSMNFPFLGERGNDAK